jgi:predicted nicotinamide N-methyase
MKINTVGKIKNIKYNSETNDLEILIKVLDSKFKKKILRDLDLAGYIYFEGNELVYNENIEKND